MHAQLHCCGCITSTPVHGQKAGQVSLQQVYYYCSEFYKHLLYCHGDQCIIVNIPPVAIFAAVLIRRLRIRNFTLQIPMTPMSTITRHITAAVLKKAATITKNSRSEIKRNFMNLYHICTLLI